MSGSAYFPFFVHLQFAGADDPKITTPVDRVLVGYEKDDGSLNRFDLYGPGMWEAFAQFVHSFSNACSRTIAPVGWRLRTLVWPAAVLNCAAVGEKLCQDLVMRMDGRWNEARMVDLSTLVGQGSWDPSTRPALREVAKFLGLDQEGPLETLVAIHRKYIEVRDRI